MPLNACCIDVIPEFGVNWKQVTKAVQSSRLPMVASSVAEVLCQHSARNMHLEDIDEILGQSQVARDTAFGPLGRGPGDRAGEVIAPESAGCFEEWHAQEQEPQGLGYAGYENAQLHGKHVASLLRIADPAWTAHADHLSHPPEYCPGPTLLSNGIDYTHAHYDEAYVDSVIGPNPPLLTDLDINSTKMFFDRSKLDKAIKLSARLKTDDICRTLKTWVGKELPVCGSLCSWELKVRASGMWPIALEASRKDYGLRLWA
ncbi:Uncharacterized protein OBRU01_04667 [Operophtera brumata]|uniref:Uncharacterized protein n=1 Tax=Operophtera brumata TaxID=104452 RepID=A0A0L7LNS4_OPEBR|nr:Uncharacterized protein OBRU01_04667 [Operophtera brumata]